jgi:hypothetical protein
MQYTSSSFAQSLVGLFSWALHPHTRVERPATAFPGSASFHSEVPDTVLDHAVLPALQRVTRALVWFRWVQRGNVHLYLLYVLAAVVLTILVLR